MSPKPNSPIAIQIAAIAAAFTLLITLSLIFMGNIVRKNMAYSMEAAFNETERNISTDLKELETLLLYVSETIRLMIIREYPFDKITYYIKVISEYNMYADERLKDYSTGIYAFFYVFGGSEGVFFDGTGWQPPDDFIPSERPWYIMAEEADGKIAITEPYVSVAMQKFTLTFARRIFDDNGNPLAIVCFDVLLDRVRNYAVNTYHAKGGYGMLLNKNLEMLAHPDSELWNKQLRDIQNYDNFANIADDLKNGKQVTERRIRNYKNEKCVLSFNQLPNGWHIGIVIQEKIYFRSLTIMRMTLILAGLLIAAFFILIILRLSAVKKELEDYKEENGLTKREQEVFALLLSGKEPKEIASSLNISYSGVNFHIKNLFGKLSIQSRAEMMVKYLKNED